MDLSKQTWRSDTMHLEFSYVFSAFLSAYTFHSLLIPLTTKRQWHYAHFMLREIGQEKIKHLSKFVQLARRGVRSKPWVDDSRIHLLTHSLVLNRLKLLKMQYFVMTFSLPFFLFSSKKLKRQTVQEAFKP